MDSKDPAPTPPAPEQTITPEPPPVLPPAKRSILVLRASRRQLLVLAVVVAALLVLLGGITARNVYLTAAHVPASSTAPAKPKTTKSSAANSSANNASSSDTASTNAPHPTKTYQSVTLGFSLVYPAADYSSGKSVDVAVFEDLPNNTVYVADATFDACGDGSSSTSSCHSTSTTLDYLKNGVKLTISGVADTVYPGNRRYTVVANASDSTVSSFMSQHSCTQDSKQLDNTKNYYDIRLSCGASDADPGDEYELFYSPGKARLAYTLRPNGIVFTDSAGIGETVNVSIP